MFTARQAKVEDYQRRYEEVEQKLAIIADNQTNGSVSEDVPHESDSYLDDQPEKDVLELDVKLFCFHMFVLCVDFKTDIYTHHSNTCA